MIKNPIFILLAMSLMACGSDGREPAETSPDASVETSAAPSDGSVTPSDGSATSSDGSAGPVDTSVASVSLSSDCPEAAARDAPLDAACSVDGCPSLCDQSSMQIRFVSEARKDQALRNVTIVAVRLLDAESGKVLDVLTSRAPGIWTGDTYSPWDQRLPSGAVQAYYKLSAPDWDAIGAAGDSSFILEVDFEIDGAKSTVRSDEVQRAPQVVT